MAQHTKSNVDQEAICQALEQLEQSMDIIHQIVKRLQRSVRLAQAKSLNDADLPPSRPNNSSAVGDNDTRFQHTGNRRETEAVKQLDEEKQSKTLH